MSATTKQSQQSLTTADVWAAIRKRSFAVLGFTTPNGEPRTSGVVYATLGHDLYVVVAPDSWKARYIAIDARVSMTVPVRRGGMLSLMAPIPPATITFPGRAEVFPPGAPEIAPVVRELGGLLPEERRDEVAVVRIRPEGTFVMYGVGVSLMRMRDTVAARARVPVA
jgi:hypothetical protein